jgi:hypothetical protein
MRVVDLNPVGFLLGYIYTVNNSDTLFQEELGLKTENIGCE